MTSTRALLFVSTLGLGLSIPGIAAAQQPSNCPPGSWFCEEAQPQAPPQTQPLQPLPPANGEPAQPPVVVQPHPRPRPAPPVVYTPYAPNPPVVVYQPPPPVMIVRPEAPPPYVYRVRPVSPLGHRNEWGLNLHLDGAMIGKGVNGDAGLGGVGFGLRYKPVPYFGVQADLDFMGGRDYNGFQRSESAFTINGMIFLNPRSITQVYLLGGFGWSSAHATDDQSYSYMSREYSYSYFGGQAGIGLELRLGRHFALNTDIRAFMRGRIDSGAQFHPEFTDPSTGRTTNTSGGGIFTGGMTFYF